MLFIKSTGSRKLFLRADSRTRHGWRSFGRLKCVPAACSQRQAGQGQPRADLRQRLRHRGPGARPGQRQACQARQKGPCPAASTPTYLGEHAVSARGQLVLLDQHGVLSTGASSAARLTKPGNSVTSSAQKRPACAHCLFCRLATSAHCELEHMHGVFFPTLNVCVDCVLACSIGLWGL